MTPNEMIKGRELETAAVGLEVAAIIGTTQSGCPGLHQVRGLLLVAVEVHGERGEYGDEPPGHQEYPADLSGRYRSVHQGANRCHQMGDGVGADDRLEPRRHGPWVHEDVAREREGEQDQEARHHDRVRRPQN